MNAYDVTMKCEHHTKSLLVIAKGYGEAEDRALEVMREWQYDGYSVSHIMIAATSCRYGKEQVLVLPK